MNKREVGSLGEDIACKYLLENGYEILERNKYFSKLCEIDIIAKFKDRIVFIEVKTRRNYNYGSPFEAITPLKYNNIKTGVLSYLQENKIYKYQIDVIGIVLEPTLQIKHLKNIAQ